MNYFDNYQVFNNRKVSLGRVASILMLCVIIYIAGFFVAFSVCFSSNYVYGASMIPTLNNYADYEHNKDIVYVDRFAAYSHGDIVVLYTGSTKIIKRVIAMPGDTINIEHDGNQYYTVRNGVRLDENGYINIKSASADYNGMKREYGLLREYKESIKDNRSMFVDPDNYLDSAIIVPNNYIFVLGDNRHVSKDSATDGPYCMDNVEGKVEIIVYAGDSALITLLNYFYNPFK